ncbi:MAG: hypothetical protein ACRD82_05690 [Blastocatellia bacterium]
MKCGYGFARMNSAVDEFNGSDGRQHRAVTGFRQGGHCHRARKETTMKNTLNRDTEEVDRIDKIFQDKQKASGRKAFC